MAIEVSEHGMGYAHSKALGGVIGGERGAQAPAHSELLGILLRTVPNY